VGKLISYAFSFLDNVGGGVSLRGYSLAMHVRNARYVRLNAYALEEMMET